MKGHVSADFWSAGLRGTTAQSSLSPARVEPDALASAETFMWRVNPSDNGADPLLAKVADTGPATGPNAIDVPAVFLHGLVGLNDHWERVVTRIRGRMRCVLNELPLLRLSGSDCSIEGVTALSIRFIREHLGGGPVLLAGNSFGGHVALRIALQQPHMVRGLVLAGSGGLVEKTLMNDIQLRPTRAWLRRKISELYFDHTTMREADVDRAFTELTNRGGARAMVRLARSARKDELRKDIEAISVPTLIMWGRQDVVTPPEAAEGFRELIKDSRLVWFDRCGHVPMQEAPDAFAAEMLAFAEKLAK